MKTIVIRITDVEAAMLAELRKAKIRYRDLQSLIREQLRREYLNLGVRSGCRTMD